MREGDDGKSYCEIGSVLEKDIPDLLDGLPLKEELYYGRYMQNLN